MNATKLDAAVQDRMRQKLQGALNGAALALMTSIGHRTGLFDVMSRMRPATSREIAVEAGLDERYVREWLGAMVSSEVIAYAPADATYSLPAEHASLLTRAARPENMAATCQWIPVLGAIEERILECFEHGGGVPYSAYARFHAVMAEESDQTVVSTLVEHILPLADGLPEALARGIDVLDVGCGSGRAMNHLALAYPRSRFTGYDISENGIEAARAEARELGLTNARFEIRDVAQLDHTDAFDCVTAFDAIHDQARPDAVLRGIAAALRPEGVFLMQDIAGTSRLEADVSHPLAAFLYTISCLHCMTVSLAAGGMGLGAMWGSELAQRMLADAGFGRLQVRKLPHDAMNLYVVARK